MCRIRDPPRLDAAALAASVQTKLDGLAPRTGFFHRVSIWGVPTCESSLRCRGAELEALRAEAAAESTRRRWALRDAKTTRGAWRAKHQEALSDADAK